MTAKKIAFYRILTKKDSSDKYKRKLNLLESEADTDTLEEADQISEQYELSKATTQTAAPSTEPVKDNVSLSYTTANNSRQTLVESIMSKEVSYDTRKALNRSTMKIPQEIAERIEKEGLPIEIIEDLGIPVFKYKTQITIHGVFDIEGGYARAGGYKSIIQNQNKSLGVRYVGVDAAKKGIIYKALRVAMAYEYWHERYEDKPSTIHWSFSQDSTGTELTLSVNIDSNDNKVVVEKMKTIYNSIPDIFIGDKSINIYSYWGQSTCRITIALKAIYEKNLWKFISFITNKTVNNQQDCDEKYQFLKLKKEEKDAREKLLDKNAKNNFVKLKAMLEDECPFDKLMIDESLTKRSVKEARIAVITDRYDYEKNKKTGEIEKITANAKIEVYHFTRTGSEKKWRYTTTSFANWEEVKNYVTKDVNSWMKHRASDTFATSVRSHIKDYGFIVSLSENTASASYGSPSKTIATSTSYTIDEKKHDKTGETIYIVRMTNRVEKDTYYRINAAIKKLGGYYSNFRGVNGFVLKNKPTEEQLKEIFG